MRSAKGLHEIQPDPAEPLGMGKRSRIVCLPGPAAPPESAGQQRGLNRIALSSEGDFNLRDLLHIQPFLIRRCGLSSTEAMNSLAHSCVSSGLFLRKKAKLAHQECPGALADQPIV